MSGPVIKKIAQKIFTDTPITDEVKSLNVRVSKVENEYKAFYKAAQTYKTIMPNLVGMPAMDALVLLENMQVKVKVKLEGSGIVKKQSVDQNIKLKNNQVVILSAS